MSGEIDLLPRYLWNQFEFIAVSGFLRIYVIWALGRRTPLGIREVKQLLRSGDFGIDCNSVASAS